jgi:diaminohydroxyphosphoribosylaminopyrimidine deaminase/5-amino-6-(5-phosphoribosylamino)uracil reductase
LQLPLNSQLVRTSAEAPVLVVAGPTAPTARADALGAAGCDVLVLEEADYQARLRTLLAELAERQMTNVLVEGGASLLGELFDAGLVNEVHVFVAPCIIGGQTGLSPVGGRGFGQVSESLRLAGSQCEPVGGDWYIRGRLA